MLRGSCTTFGPDERGLFKHDRGTNWMGCRCRHDSCNGRCRGQRASLHADPPPDRDGCHRARERVVAWERPSRHPRSDSACSSCAGRARARDARPSGPQTFRSGQGSWGRTDLLPSRLYDGCHPFAGHPGTVPASLRSASGCGRSHSPARISVWSRPSSQARVISAHQHLHPRCDRAPAPNRPFRHVGLSARTILSERLGTRSGVPQPCRNSRGRLFQPWR